MRIVQFQTPTTGRRVGIVEDNDLRDLTAVRPDWQRAIDIFHSAEASAESLATLIRSETGLSQAPCLDYQELLHSDSTSGQPFLHPPLDAKDPYHVLVSGTGLTHLGGMQARNQMHSTADAPQQDTKTDSLKMFEMGLADGKPPLGTRGVAPEWFYKGNGLNIRGHRQALDIPAHARDGGEEAEIVGCYIVDRHGNPRRLGFALGNEWSDHATEKQNYLYLAPSKLMRCAVGPELILNSDFQAISLQCTVRRSGNVIYDSGELWSGEQHMCHSLANCEDHHFKFPQHRHPGDIHLHFFGTSKLSYGLRDWTYADGDEVQVAAPGFSATLVNSIRLADDPPTEPISVQTA